MSRIIYFEESELNNLINGRLECAKNNLNRANRISNQLNIPNDFKYRIYLYNLKNSLNSDYSDVNNILNIIKNSSRSFNNIENDLNYSLSGIENYSINMRQSAIK